MSLPQCVLCPVSFLSHPADGCLCLSPVLWTFLTIHYTALWGECCCDLSLYDENYNEYDEIELKVNWSQFISAEKHLSAWLCLQHRKEHRTNKVQVNGDIWNEAAYSSKHWHACHICFCSLAFKLLLLILKVFPFSCPYLLLLLHCQRSLQIYLSKVGMTKGVWQMRGSGNERVLLNALWI